MWHVQITNNSIIDSYPWYIISTWYILLFTVHWCSLWVYLVAIFFTQMANPRNTCIHVHHTWAYKPPYTGIPMILCDLSKLVFSTWIGKYSCWGGLLNWNFTNPQSLLYVNAHDLHKSKTCSSITVYWINADTINTTN